MLVSGGHGHHPSCRHGHMVDTSGHGSWVILAMVVIALLTLVVSHPGSGSWIIQMAVVFDASEWRDCYCHPGRSLCPLSSSL